ELLNWRGAIMRFISVCLMSLVICSLTLGCGNNGFIKARGHLVKDGVPYLIPEGQGLRIFFAPVNTDGTRYDSYSASYDPEDGSFVVTGKDGRGLPPGAYHIDIQLRQGREDLLGGRLGSSISGLTLEVTPDSKDLVIDLDQTPFDKALDATRRQLSRKSR